LTPDGRGRLTAAPYPGNRIVQRCGQCTQGLRILKVVEQLHAPPAHPGIAVMGSLDKCIQNGLINANLTEFRGRDTPDQAPYCLVSLDMRLIGFA